MPFTHLVRQLIRSRKIPIKMYPIYEVTSIPSVLKRKYVDGFIKKVLCVTSTAGQSESVILGAIRAAPCHKTAFSSQGFSLTLCS